MPNEETQPNIDQLVAERYQLLPPEITELIEFKATDLAVEKIANTYNLNRIKRDSLENEIFLVLLLFLPKSGFSERIKESLEIDAALAEIISDTVQAEVFDLVDDILTAAERELLETIPATQQGEPEPTAAGTENRAEITPTPASELIERLSALRTMQGDAERIHGYGAYRRRSEPTANKPQPNTSPLATPPRYVDTDEGDE